MIDKKKLLESVSNSSCQEDILVSASNDNENYFSSRIRYAVALNENTPKKIINKLLKDEYRWVRQAASSSKLLNDDNITELVKNGDRYILKGLLDNKNTPEEVKIEIIKMLEDIERYPIEMDTYVIEVGDSYESVGGTMDIDYLAELIADEFFDQDTGELPGEWHDWDDLYHNVGDYNLKDSIQMPDGSYENLNLSCKTKITDCKADFIITMNSGLDDYGENYEIELEGLFEPNKLTIDYEEYGRVYSYSYNGEAYHAETDSIGGASWDGYEHEYAWESLYIQINTDSGYKDFDIDQEISEMKKNKVDTLDKKSIMKALKEKYRF